MTLSFVGRQAELAVLQKAYSSDEPELVAVVGRRRVGKTCLVRSAFSERLDFEITGIQNGSEKEQLQHFSDRLNYHARSAFPIKRPANWMEAFQMLITYLEGKAKKEKWVIFLDEFPWLAKQKSEFIRAFGLFWNSWASQNRMLVVICGSAASWMIEHVVRDKGGLHNRITRRIHLAPFSLYETELFLKSRGVNLSRYHILQIYMAMGGIPHYLKSVEAGKTATQIIDEACFSPHGFLRDEFLELYPALFDQAEQHIKIVRSLATTRQGMTRQDIIESTGLTDGGNTSRTIEELVNSGFISPYFAFGKKKKDIRYRLTDEYSLFYLKFIEENRFESAGTWEKLTQAQTWKSWSGYAFESICLKHLISIKNALGISGVYTEASAYYLKKSELGRGVQIDLVLDRNDHAIHLFEIKFYQTEFALNKEMADDFRMKSAIFKTESKSTKHIFLTLLSTFPLKTNEHSLGLIDQVLDMNCLFQPLNS